MSSRVAFITANFGGYELTCKPFKTQTIPSDFIYFTDATVTEPNGWTIDTTPWHEKIETPKGLRNSLENNKHTFNIAKFYKQNFQSIPRLSEYEMIIWVDGSLEISSETVAERCLGHPIVAWVYNQPLKIEVEASHISKYISTYWNEQDQPYQDIDEQYEVYKADGIPDFETIFITCFTAYDNKDPKVSEFLKHWYYQTLRYTTSDQISFVYSVYKIGVQVLALEATDSSSETDFYIKSGHSGPKKHGNITCDDPFSILKSRPQPEGSYYLTIGHDLNVIQCFRSFIGPDEEVYHLADTSNMPALIRKQKDKFISVLCLINIRDQESIDFLSCLTDKRTSVIFL
jgi:hypothetical protein